jgi:hypothetical protein
VTNPPRCWWVWWVSCGGIGSTQKGLHKPTKSLYTGGFGGFLSGSSKKWNPSGINPPAICPISSGWQSLTGVVAKHRSGRTADIHCHWARKRVNMTDSARYRQCGNGCVVNVVEWIGRRLVAADESGES